MENNDENKTADDQNEMGDNVNIVSVKEDSKIPNKDIEAKLPAPRKSGREEKARKKDDRSVEQVLKALNSLDTTEEKLAAMCKKYADTVDENRKLQVSLKQMEKRVVMLQREKEQLQTEHSKAVLTRSRLESLCRELQRQNKAVKDESLLKIREEEEKRKEVSAKFQSTLADVTALMQQNNEKNCKLREDNLEMTKKFKSVCEQYELREQQVEKISKQMQLESQLADARLSKAKMEMAAEKETLLREKQQLLLEVVECQAKIQDLQATETSLRSQISLYTNKYDEFQNALSRSNDVFEGFKGEMEKMSKKICKLEKETSSWKQRWEKSHQALLEMAADKQQRDGELQLTTRQLAQLQKLCRTLQAERTSLLAQLKTAAKSETVEDTTPESPDEKGQGDDKNSSDGGVLTNLDSALSESEATETQQSAPELKPLSALAQEAVPSAVDTKNENTASPAPVVPTSSPVDTKNASPAPVVPTSSPTDTKDDNTASSAPVVPTSSPADTKNVSPTPVVPTSSATDTKNDNTASSAPVVPTSSPADTKNDNTASSAPVVPTSSPANTKNESTASPAPVIPTSASGNSNSNPVASSPANTGNVNPPVSGNSKPVTLQNGETEPKEPVVPTSSPANTENLNPAALGDTKPVSVEIGDASSSPAAPVATNKPEETSESQTDAGGETSSPKGKTASPKKGKEMGKKRKK